MDITQELIANRLYVVYNGQYYVGCRRCGGTGHYSFDGMSTICYACGNTPKGRLGGLLGDRAAAEAHAERLNRAQAKRDALRNAKAQKALADLEEAQNEFAAKHPDVAAYLVAAYEDDSEPSSFIRNMASRYHSQEIVKWGFSQKQVDAIARVIADRQNREAVKAELGPVETGRRDIQGTIQSIKEYENQFGTTVKMLVITTTGHKVFGSVPNALVEGRTYDSLVGQTVSFTATVEASNDDASFGIFKRPTKAAFTA